MWIAIALLFGFVVGFLACCLCIPPIDERDYK